MKRVRGKAPFRRCEGCSKKTRRIYLTHHKYLCYRCYRKKTGNIGLPLKFEDYLSHHFIVELRLTTMQSYFLKERTKFLKMKPSQYIRELIITDMEECDR